MHKLPATTNVHIAHGPRTPSHTIYFWNEIFSSELTHVEPQRSWFPLPPPAPRPPHPLMTFTVTWCGFLEKKKKTIKIFVKLHNLLKCIGRETVSESATSFTKASLYTKWYFCENNGALRSIYKKSLTFIMNLDKMLNVFSREHLHLN